VQVEVVEEQLVTLRKEKEEVVHRLAESGKEKQALDKKCNQVGNKKKKICIARFPSTLGSSRFTDIKSNSNSARIQIKKIISKNRQSH
jgi:hypothetical protein